MVQMFTPLWMVALVQWLILHIYLSRQTTSRESRLHMNIDTPSIDADAARRLLELTGA